MAEYQIADLQIGVQILLESTGGDILYFVQILLIVLFQDCAYMLGICNNKNL